MKTYYRDASLTNFLTLYRAIVAQILVIIIVMIKVATKASLQFLLLGAFAILAAPHSRKESGNKSQLVVTEDDTKRFAVHILCKRLRICSQIQYSIALSPLSS
ncbi:MAG: hypothetical protein KA015_02295 [Spirochaetes bacterium]|nr:hypothetical protein [Spirochaetota bacterium]